MGSLRKMMHEEYEGDRFARPKEKLLSFGSNVLDVTGMPKREIYRELSKENWQEELGLIRKFGGVYHLQTTRNPHVEVYGVVVGRAQVGNPSKERPQFYTPDLHITEVYDVSRTDTDYSEFRRNWIISDFDKRNAFKGPIWFSENQIIVDQDGEITDVFLRSNDGHIRPTTLFTVLEMLQEGIRRDLQ